MEEYLSIAEALQELNKLDENENLNEGFIDNIINRSRNLSDKTELAIDKIGAPALTAALSGVFGALGLLGGIPGALVGGAVGFGVAVAAKKFNNLVHKLLDNIAERRSRRFEKKFTEKISEIEQAYGKELNDKQKAFIRIQMINDKELKQDPEIKDALKDLSNVKGFDVNKLIDLIDEKINVNLDDGSFDDTDDEEEIELKEAYRDNNKLFTVLDSLKEDVDPNALDKIDKEAETKLNAIKNYTPDQLEDAAEKIEKELPQELNKLSQVDVNEALLEATTTLDKNVQKLYKDLKNAQAVRDKIRAKCEKILSQINKGKDLTLEYTKALNEYRLAQNTIGEIETYITYLQKRANESLNEKMEWLNCPNCGSNDTDFIKSNKEMKKFKDFESDEDSDNENVTFKDGTKEEDVGHYHCNNCGCDFTKTDVDIKYSKIKDDDFKNENLNEMLPLFSSETTEYQEPTGMTYEDARDGYNGPIDCYKNICIGDTIEYDGKEYRVLKLRAQHYNYGIGLRIEAKLQVLKGDNAGQIIWDDTGHDISILSRAKKINESLNNLNESPLFTHETTEYKIYNTYLKYYPEDSWEGRERILKNASRGSASDDYSFGSCDEEILKICKDDDFKFTGQYKTCEDLIEGSKHVKYGDFLRFKINYDKEEVYSWTEHCSLWC